MFTMRGFVAVVAASALVVSAWPLLAQSSSETSSPLAKNNLLAWCVGQFDAAKRGPEERAQMLDRLGIKRFALDYDSNGDIRGLDREIDALQHHGIELTAVWVWSDTEPEKNTVIYAILDLLERRAIKTQLWVYLASTDSDDFQRLSQNGKIEWAAKPLSYLSKKAKALGCSVGLYAHGGWYGDPDNQIAIIRHLKMDNVGIVYNLHHGHEHIDRFPTLLSQMKPYLMCLNLSGLKKGGPQILPIGEGDYELDFLKTVARSGYHGPVGIIDHRSELDSELSLQQNIDGLRKLVETLGDDQALRTY